MSTPGTDPCIDGGVLPDLSHDATSPDLVRSFDLRPIGWRVFGWLRNGALLGAALTTVSIAAWTRPDRLLVERVEFTGAARTSEVGLRHLVDVRNGTTIWGVDLERAERGAESHPWVRDATVRRRWPDAVVVEIEEYVPVALLQQEGLHYVASDATVFLRARSDDLDYPVITGVAAELGRTHPDLPRLVVRDALALLGALDERGLIGRDEISEVAFAASRGFTVHTHTGARVIFGLDGRSRQLDRLSKLFQQGLDLSRPIHVDLAPASLAIVRPLERGAG